MRCNWIGMAVAACVLAAPFAVAQQATVDHWTQAELTAKAQALVAKAEASGGNASTKLTEYPNHFTMIAIREKSGGAEVHPSFADFFYVVQGHATLVSGGTVQNQQVASSGEIKGTAVEGGTRQELNPGDFVHIPAGVPHQLLLPKGESFTYFVIKVKEK